MTGTAVRGDNHLWGSRDGGCPLIVTGSHLSQRKSRPEMSRGRQHMLASNPSFLRLCALNGLMLKMSERVSRTPPVDARDIWSNDYCTLVPTAAALICSIWSFR